MMPLVPATPAASVVVDRPRRNQAAFRAGPQVSAAIPVKCMAETANPMSTALASFNARRSTRKASQRAALEAAMAISTDKSTSLES